MDHVTLLSKLDRPRVVGLSVKTWYAAAVLAGLRVASNDPIRRQDRDRGQDKNPLADTWGTLGELVALRVLNSITDLPIDHHPIDFDRPVDDVDLAVRAPDGPLRLEAKAHLLERNKVWFMVNERARRRSKQRGAIGYIPVVTSMGSPRALVGRLISANEMDRWGSPSVPLKDPAIGVRLAELAKTHFGRRLSEVKVAVASDPPVVSHSVLERVTASAGLHRDYWRLNLAPLESLPAQEVVDVVNRLLLKKV